MSLAVSNMYIVYIIMIVIHVCIICIQTSEVQCVSWDENAAGETLLASHHNCNYSITMLPPCKDGSGNWTNSGCSTNGPSSDGIVKCSCNHLANFALLVVSTVAYSIAQKKNFVFVPTCAEH